MSNSKWWILNYPRPLGPAPVVYEKSPPNQSIELVWHDEQEGYMQDPWSEASPHSFSSEFEAIKYLTSCGHKIDEIKIVRVKPELKSL